MCVCVCACVCVSVQVLFFFGSRYAHSVNASTNAVRVAGWMSSVCGYTGGTSGGDIGGWK
jgi:hypothetical protein